MNLRKDQSPTGTKPPTPFALPKRCPLFAPGTTTDSLANKH